MRPRSLSATAIQRYEQCPKGFVADLTSKVRTDSAPGLFGTALHAALDKYIEKLGISPDLPAKHDPDLLMTAWDAASNVYLGYGNDYHAEGVELLSRWVATRDLPYEVISREVKRSFEVTPDGGDGGETQRVNYIIDRLDRRDDGTVEVIDYKSQWEILSHEQMRHLVQPGLYAVAVRRELGVGNVLVTYDFLRGNPITIEYDDAGMDEIEAYLARVVRRVWEDTEPVEKLNKNCRYCIRKGACQTLARATEAGWLPNQPVEHLVSRRDGLIGAKKAIESMLGEIDEAILEELRRLDTPDLDTGTHIVRAQRAKRVTFDPEVVMRVLGDEALAYMRVGKTELEKEFKRRKGGRFTPDQIEAVRDMATVTYGEPHINVEPKGGHEVE